jgi:hypothetical protein
LSCLVKHHPHHLVSAPRYCAAPVDLAGLISSWRQSEVRSNRFGTSKTRRHINRRAIGQCDDRADARYRHQATAHIVIPDDGQQATMKNANLFAERPADNEQGFDQLGKIWEIFE